MDDDENELPGEVPAGWLPLMAAIEWVAFGTVAANWDQDLYFGASEWATMHPDAVHNALLASEWSGANKFRGGDYDAPFLACLLDMEAREVAGLSTIATVHEGLSRSLEVVSQSFSTEDAKTRCADLERTLRELESEHSAKCAAFTSKMMSQAAEKIRARLLPPPRPVEDTYYEIIDASEALRRAIGCGSVPAFGRVGAAAKYELPGLFDLVATLPPPVAPSAQRVRIPPEACQAPVTLSDDGILPFIHGYDPSPKPGAALWSDIVLDGPDLLRWRPSINGDASARRPAPSARRRGRPPAHDWGGFTHEILRVVHRDNGTLTRTDLRRHMKDWVGQHMADGPEDRTIERQIALLVPPDVIP